jgi:hypothetical protein
MVHQSIPDRFFGDRIARNIGINGATRSNVVVIVLLDDLGFGGTSATGSVLHTPNMDQVASEGLLFTPFHTTALCSPTSARSESTKARVAK